MHSTLKHSFTSQNFFKLTSFFFLIRLGDVWILSLVFFLCVPCSGDGRLVAGPAPLEAVGSPLVPPPPLGLVGEVAVEEEEEEDEDVALVVGEVCPSSSAPASLQEKSKYFQKMVSALKMVSIHHGIGKYRLQSDPFLLAPPLAPPTYLGGSDSISSSLISSSSPAPLRSIF